MAQQINLFNPIFLRQKRHFSALAMVQAFALVGFGVLAIYAYEVRQIGVLTRVAAGTDQQVDAQRDQLTRFAKEFSTIGANRVLGEELSAAETRLAERQALLEDVKTGAGGDAQGYSRFLTALARETMGGVWITGLDIGGTSGALVIKGRALESALVPAYIRALNREEPLAGRRVSELRLTAKEGTKPAPGAPITKADDVSRDPPHFIEFSLAIPLKARS